MNGRGQIAYVTTLFVALTLVIVAVYGFTTFNKPVSSLSRDVASAQLALETNQNLILQIINQSATDAGHKSTSLDTFRTNFIAEMRKRDYSTTGLESVFTAVYTNSFTVLDTGSVYEVSIPDVIVGAQNPSLALDRKVTLRVQYIYK